ncbi:MAG: hypothetical protein EOM51_08575 [Clostridia bacterium]|nr:hypothetical protein [Clostridia bacterium]
MEVNFLSEADRKFVVDELNKRIKMPVCPFCGSNSYTLIDGANRVVLQDNLMEFNISGKNIPVIIISCSNCGHLDYFAIKAIIPDVDLHSSKEENNNEQ